MLIAEVGRERRLAGELIPGSTADAPCSRFQPTVMTSAAFISGMALPALCIGADATGRNRRGMCGVSEVIASTTPPVRFVPAVRGALQVGGVAPDSSPGQRDGETHKRGR